MTPNGERVLCRWQSPAKADGVSRRRSATATSGRRGYPGRRRRSQDRSAHPCRPAACARPSCARPPCGCPRGRRGAASGRRGRPSLFSARWAAAGRPGAALVSGLRADPVAPVRITSPIGSRPDEAGLTGAAAVLKAAAGRGAGRAGGRGVAAALAWTFGANNGAGWLLVWKVSALSATSRCRGHGREPADDRAGAPPHGGKRRPPDRAGRRRLAARPGLDEGAGTGCEGVTHGAWSSGRSRGTPARG